VNNNPTEDVTVRILRNDYTKGNGEKIQGFIMWDARHETEPESGKKRIEVIAQAIICKCTA
jgi:hypothetical protein